MKVVKGIGEGPKRLTAKGRGGFHTKEFKCSEESPLSASETLGGTDIRFPHIGKQLRPAYSHLKGQISMSKLEDRI